MIIVEGKNYPNLEAVVQDLREAFPKPEQLHYYLTSNLQEVNLSELEEIYQKINLPEYVIFEEKVTHLPLKVENVPFRVSVRSQAPLTGLVQVRYLKALIKSLTASLEEVSRDLQTSS